MSTQVHNIFKLNESKKFNADEAYKLVELFNLVTHKSRNKINALRSQIEYHKSMPAQASGFEKLLNLELQKWSEKIRRLGGVPLSLYQVKITSKEEGFFLWEYPKLQIEHHH